jgi:hypothetical protein
MKMFEIKTKNGRTFRVIVAKIKSIGSPVPTKCLNTTLVSVQEGYC